MNIPSEAANCPGSSGPARDPPPYTRGHMVFLALNWRVWLVIGLLFLYGLARRMFRQWRRRRLAGRR